MSEKRGTIPGELLPEKVLRRIGDVYEVMKVERGTTYRFEQVFARGEGYIGQELLYGGNISLIDTGEASFVLFQKGITEAISRIIAGEKGYFSVNAFIEDIQHPKIRDFIQKLPLRREDKKRIVIEIVERPGQVRSKFAANMHFLRHKQGFSIFLDDFDLDFSFGSEVNASRELYRHFPTLFDAVKLPHEYAMGILNGDPRLIARLKVLEKKKVILEGCHSSADLRRLPSEVSAIQIHNA